jgi:hypothetical protein
MHSSNLKGDNDDVFLCILAWTYSYCVHSEWHVCLLPGYKQPYLKICYCNAIHTFDFASLSGRGKETKYID